MVSLVSLVKYLGGVIWYLGYGPGHLSSVPGTSLIPWYLGVVPSYLGRVLWFPGWGSLVIGVVGVVGMKS